MVVGAAALVGCGPGDPVKTWIARDAAAIHCTVASSTARVPPVAGELPTVPAPNQFFLRDFAPVDLHDLGFAPQTTVCAALMVPSGEAVAREQEELTAAREERDALVKKMRRADPCLCEQLRALELLWFDASCHDTPVQFGCPIDDVLAQRALGDKLAEIEAWRSATRVRPRHWRLAGTTDRPAVFEHRLRRIRRRYRGPVELFDRTRSATSGPSTQLVNALLKEPSVVMVLRIDRGRSIMVVREPKRGVLVLDLFEKPIYQDAGVAMLGALDDAHPDLYLEMLRQPSKGYSPPAEVSAARTVELDFAGLERAEEALRGLARFFGVKILASVAAGEEAEALVDRVTWTVSLSDDPRASEMSARLHLSPAGREWVSAARDARLMSSVYDAAEALENIPSPLFEAWAREGVEETAAAEPGQTRDSARDIVASVPLGVRAFWAHGLARAAVFLSAAEYAAPGSLSGTVDAWRLQIGLGFRPGDLAVPSGLTRLMSRLSTYPHALSGAVAEGGQTVEIRLQRP